MTTLTLHDVAISRGAGPVVSHVSLTVRPGTITALIGPNGAGKTSVLESVSGIVQTSSGKISVDGADIATMSRRKRFKLGIVHVEQGRAVFPSLTVRENLEITAKTATHFDDALALFPELEKRLTSATGLLSGGEQQMVVLARAFAAQPKLLLLDEMSLGLAPVVYLRLMPIVSHIADTGVGILLVEQFAHLALQIATEAVVITGGRVTYSGSAGVLLSSSETLQKAYLG